MNDLDIEIKIEELEKHGYFRVYKDYILQNANKESALYRKHVKESPNENLKKNF